MAKVLPVDIWSDIACPWCYVGKRRFEAALVQFAAEPVMAGAVAHGTDALTAPQPGAPAPVVRVTWRAFELDPSALPNSARDPNETHAQRLSRKYGMSVAQAQQRTAQLVALAAAEGLRFDFDHIKPGNTFDAHRLVHMARERGRGDALKERFLSAYLCEGRALEPSELLPLVADVGLDVDEAQSILSTDGYTAEVRADEREAQQLGIQGVPFFRIGRYGVSGAQPTELFARALRQAWSELPEPFGLADAGNEATVCGPDGCS